MKKKYPLGVGKYYFNINSGLQKVLIHRSNKDDAIRRFSKYIEMGKDGEWLGCWNGKQFTDTSVPNLK